MVSALIDDCLVGIIGPKALAVEVQNGAKTFLQKHLHPYLSEEKTRIMHLKTEEARSLNLRLKVASCVKVRVVKTRGKRVHTKRVTGWSPLVHAPVLKIIARLKQAGFCVPRGGKVGFPCSKKSLVAFEDHEIIMRFNAVWQGIYNYYCISDSAAQLRRIIYIFQYSCLKTLCRKHRTSLKQMIARRGIFPSKSYWLANGSIKTAMFLKPKAWQSFDVVSAKPLNLEVLMAKQLGRLTRSHLNNPCAVCGKGSGIEMHHVRALRKNNADMPEGFSKISSAVQRKQVPLCVACHDAVHAGSYDGPRLKDLAYAPQ